MGSYAPTWRPHDTTQAAAAPGNKAHPAAADTAKRPPVHSSPAPLARPRTPDRAGRLAGLAGLVVLATACEPPPSPLAQCLNACEQTHQECAACCELLLGDAAIDCAVTCECNLRCCRAACDPTRQPWCDECSAASPNLQCDPAMGRDQDGDGYTPQRGDCDDHDPLIHPGRRELADGVDQDCDGHTDEDLDGDGYASFEGDCDDADSDRHPGQVDGHDGVDNDCDGRTDEDHDFDGDSFSASTGDCDESDPLINPGMPEICDDGLDNNCNGLADDDEPDVDRDGYRACAGDCDDRNTAISPDSIEDPDNGLDDDCDGLTDEPREACDCGASTDLAGALEACDRRFVLDVRTNADSGSHRYVNQAVGFFSGFGAIVPRTAAAYPAVTQLLADNCAFVMLCNGRAGSRTPQQGDDLGGSDPDPLTPGERAFDLAQLRLQLQAPPNARSLMFDFIFLSSEYPEFVCTQYNDTFYAIMASSALGSSVPVNISFDEQRHEITVNNNFFEAPGAWTQDLSRTGYDARDAGAGCSGSNATYPDCSLPDPCPPANNTVGSATGWLRTRAPVTPRETLTLIFSIHDEGDHILDSCVIVDNFMWSTREVGAPGTEK